MIKNIYFSNIKCTGENGLYVSGESADKIKNIVFDQVGVSIDKTTAIPGGVYHRRPASVAGFVKGKTPALYFDKANGITICNCSLQWGKNVPAYYAHALKSYGVKNLKVAGFDGKSVLPLRLPAQMIRQ